MTGETAKGRSIKVIRNPLPRKRNLVTAHAAVTPKRYSEAPLPLQQAASIAALSGHPDQSGQLYIHPSPSSAPRLTQQLMAEQSAKKGLAQPLRSTPILQLGFLLSRTRTHSFVAGGVEGDGTYQNYSSFKGFTKTRYFEYAVSTTDTNCLRVSLNMIGCQLSRRLPSTRSLTNPALKCVNNKQHKEGNEEQ